MGVLIGVLAHDRPELLARSLESLALHTSAGSRFSIFVDGGDADVRGIVDAFPLPAIRRVSVGTAVGAAIASNAILRDRQPGESFCQFATDVVVTTPAWDERLEGHRREAELAAVSPVWPSGRPDRRDGARFGPGDPWGTVIPCSGVNLIGPEYCERIGAWRSYGDYGREDMDYFWRIHYAGGKVAYCPDVVVENLDANYQGTHQYRIKRAKIEATKWDWARNRERYAQGLDLYQELR